MHVSTANNFISTSQLFFCGANVIEQERKCNDFYHRHLLYNRVNSQKYRQPHCPHVQCIPSTLIIEWYLEYGKV